jgi:hypothetical protein
LNAEEFHNDLKFYELMNVSAGRYSTEYIYEQLNAREPRVEEESEFGKFEFNMKNKAHKSVITENNAQELK